MSRLINVAQGSDEWFAARLGVPSASRFNDILAKTRTGYSSSRKNYAAELALEIVTGQRAESYTSAAMQNGIEFETVARLEYELATGNDVDETGFYKHDVLETGASPDGLVGDDGLIEIKNPLPANHVETLRVGKIPRQYIAQVQGQMWLTGRKWCDFVSYCAKMPQNAQLFIARVERDEEYIADLEKEITDFLGEVAELVEFIKNYK